jgi:hypothetical protein
MLRLVQTASAQTVGDAAAGKACWDRLAPRLSDCKDCHGLNGEGGFPQTKPMRELSGFLALHTGAGR